MAGAPCGCGGVRRVRAAGRPTPRAVPNAVTASGTARAVGAGDRWTTTCTDDGGPFTSVLAAARAARKCGGRVNPA